MDMMTAIFAANKAKVGLEESGKVAKTTVKEAYSRTKIDFSYNEEVGCQVAQISGTVGVKETDLYARVFLDKNGSFICSSEYVPVTNPLFIGNLGLAGMGDDTGEDFCVLFDFDQDVTLVLTRYSGGEHTMQVDRKYEAITPIDPKYLPPSYGGSIKIDLAKYGLDVFSLFAQGGGVVTFDKNYDVLALVNANPDSDFTFVIRNDYAGVYVETPATKAGATADNVNGLFAYVPLFYAADNGSGAYALGLFITAYPVENTMLTVQKLN